MKAREKQRLEREFFRLMASDFTAEPDEGLFGPQRAAKPRAAGKPRPAAKRGRRRAAALTGEEYARFFGAEGSPQGAFSF